jgi:hypothetical protein
MTNINIIIEMDVTVFAEKMAQTVETTTIAQQRQDDDERQRSATRITFRMQTRPRESMHKFLQNYNKNCALSIIPGLSYITPDEASS